MYSVNEQLILALRKRNYKEAERLIKEENADINYRNIRGETLAFTYARNSSINELKWLISQGADLDIPNDLGDTPLFFAVTKGDFDAVDTLLSANANVDKKNARSIYPLMQAVLSEKDPDNKILSRLLEASPDIDATSENGTTALLAAAARGKATAVSMLIDAGADVEVADYLGQGLLHAAILSYDHNTFSTVTDKAPMLDPDYAASSGTTPMSLSVGLPHVTEKLLDMGGDPNAKIVNKIHDGLSLLMSIIASDQNPDVPIKKSKDDKGCGLPVGPNFGSQSLVDKMISAGADISARDDFGRNAGFFIFNSLATRHLSALIGAGFDPNRPLSPSSHLPYDLLGLPMVDRENPEVLDLISTWHGLGFPFQRPVWDEKIDGPITKNMEKSLEDLPTILQIYAINQFWDGIEKCLSLGAPINDTDSSGATLAHYLVSTNTDGMNNETRKALAIAMRAKKVDQATKEQQLEEIKQEAREKLSALRNTYNSYNIDWNKQSNSGKTPLHVAAKNGNMEWAKYLMMEVQVDPTLKDAEGLNPADLALKHGHIEMFHALTETANLRGYDLRSGTILRTTQASSDNFVERQSWLKAVAALGFTKEEINFKDNEGKDALYIASSTSQHDVVRTLLKLGANPDSSDSVGNTAIMQATFNEDGEIIRLLRAAGANSAKENNQGQNAFDVADYVKSNYVHEALSSDNLSELIQDIENRPLTKEELELKNRFNVILENVVRGWKDEPLLEVPEIKKEEKEENKVSISNSAPTP